MQQEQAARPAEGRVSGGNGRMTLAMGTVLAQRYQITHVVGLGGMSTVYAARDLRFSSAYKACAVKEMAVSPHGSRIANC